MAKNSKISIINDIKKYSLITKNEYELDFTIIEEYNFMKCLGII